MVKLSAETERELRVAGWTPGRTVDTASWRQELESDGFRMHEEADRFLAEFGGLVVDVSGPGITSAREPFELDPTLACGEVGKFSDWSERIGVSLFPIGELDHGRFFLAIDESGKIYLVADWVASFGPKMEAMEGLVLGMAPIPVKWGDHE